MNEAFLRMDFFLTKVLNFEKIHISTSRYLGYESIFLLHSIIDSEHLAEESPEKNNGKKIIRLGKKTIEKEIEEIEKKCSLKLQAYADKHNKHGESVLIEEKTLAFDVINCSSDIEKQLVLVRGFSFFDVENQTERLNEYFDTLNQLQDKKA